MKIYSKSQDLHPLLIDLHSNILLFHFITFILSDDEKGACLKTEAAEIGISFCKLLQSKVKIAGAKVIFYIFFHDLTEYLLFDVF